MSAPPLYYGVICPSGGAVQLTEVQYRQQLYAAGERWRCPKCGMVADWDEKAYDDSYRAQLAYETMRSYGAGVRKLATIKELYDTTTASVDLRLLLNMDFSSLEQRVLAIYPDPTGPMLTVGYDSGCKRGDFSVVSYRRTGGRSILREKWEARCKEAARLGYEPEPDDD